MQCAVWSSSIKNTKPKRTQKGMQNQSMMPSGLPTWCQLGGHTHTHNSNYNYNYNYISCRAAGRNAVVTEAPHPAQSRRSLRSGAVH